MRRLILQIHLWSALICGAYVILISLTGSAVVLRREFGRWFSPPSFIEVGETRLSDTAIEALMAEAWPDYTVVSVGPGSSDRVPVPVILARGDTERERRVNPYTGEDLGDPYPWQLELMVWLVDLHDNLLSGRTGRTVNGVGGLVFTLIVVTGLILWWPRGAWRHAFTFSFAERGAVFLRRLHSASGIWTLPLLLIWGLTAAYFGFPEPVENAIDYFDDDPMDFERPGEPFLLLLIAGHFGRFGPFPVRIVWILAGFIPVLLLVSGVLLWLRRRRVKRSA